MPTFMSVQYIDPFGPLPTGTSQAGVLVNLNASTAPSNTVAYAQLLANQTPIGYGSGSTASFVRVLNTMPLAAGVAYTIQVQYAASNQNPADLDWSNPQNVSSAPVIVQQPIITALSVASGGIVYSWAGDDASYTGTYVQIIDNNTGSIVVNSNPTVFRSSTVSVPFVEGHSYFISISALSPIVGDNAYNSPYTVGPPTIPQPFPTGAPVVNHVAYDGDSIAVQWTRPGVPTSAPVPRYEMVLIASENVLSVAPAGPQGGQCVAGNIGSISEVRVAGRVSYGTFVGSAGRGVILNALAPEIISVAVTGSSSSATITAQLSSPGALPTGGVLLATLYKNGVADTTQTLSTATGSVAWSSVAYDANTVFTIDVALQVTSGAQVSLGPRCQQIAVPLVAPQSVTAGYDGQTTVIDFGFAAAPAADGYLVTLSATGASTITVNAGASLPISFPANLDVSKAWTVTVTPSVGIVSTLSGSSTVTLPTIAAPTLTSVVYDGASLFLQWSAAVLPFITGYRVNVSGGPTVVTTADQTSCTIPLTMTQANNATVNLTGISPLRNTAASAGVSVLSNVITISAVTVDSNVVATWTVSGTAPAIRAELLIGDTVQSVLSDASATGVTFTAPTPASQPYRLRARAVSSDGVAAGPPAAPVDLILTAPAFKSGYLGDGQMSLRWDPVNPFGVTGYLLMASPAGGNPVSFAVSGDGYEGFAPAAFLSNGTLTITPTNARCSGPAATVIIRNPGSFTTGSYSDGVLTIDLRLSEPNPAAGESLWLDALVNGAVVARDILVQTSPGLSSPFTVDFAIPEGANAALRIVSVGPSSLAPVSALAAIPSVTPTMLKADYDGSKLHVSWVPTPGPGVDGYVVSVTNSAIADTYVAGAGSASVAIAGTLAYPFAQNIAVTVRAAAGSPNSEPYIQGQPSLPLPPLLSGYAYSVAVGDAGNPPYIYRRGAYQALGDVSGQAIVLYLPKPFTIGTNPTVPSSGSPVFQLAPASGDPPLPYQLTISADAWSTLGADGVRTSLHDSYVQFLSDVEDQGVFPWAIPLLRQMIAEAMPQTFEEVLYYRYGWWHDNSMQVVDLTAGTRLQLSNALYQAIVSGTSEKNGFLAVGTEWMDVVDAIPQSGAATPTAGPARSLSVDAFLSQIYPGAATSGVASVVAAGSIDFFTNQNRQSYYRLFYPAQFLSSGSNGSTTITSNMAIIGAATWKTLSDVTAQYAQNGSFPLSGYDYFAAYFRGRSALTPLINVNVQDEQRWVAVGSTVRQLLAAQGLAPYFGGNGGDAIAMKRASANLFAYSTADAGLALNTVNLGNQDLGGLTPLYWPLDMPVVGGDQVNLRQI